MRRLTSAYRHVLIGGVFCSAVLPSLQARVELQPCKNNFSPEQQVQLGRKAGQDVYKQMPVLPDTSATTQYISQLGMKLAGQAPGYKWPYNFHVVNVAEINAFALPGGTVFVNLGAIQAAQNEAQLAGVMAHELSHVILQHSVCNAEKQQKVGLLAGIGSVAAGVLLGGGLGQVAGQGIQMGAGLGFLKMSRGAEQQADLEGVGILYDAGYDPHGMPQFFEIIQAKYGAGGAQFLSDHPNPGNRTEYINKEISTFVAKPTYVTATPAFTTIHNQVGSMRAYTSKEVAAGAWRAASPQQTVGSGVNQPLAPASVAGPADPQAAGSWQTFRGQGFSMDYPQTWQASGNANAAMIAPPNGLLRSGNGSSAGLAFGALTDVYQSNNPDLGSSVQELLQTIAQQNAGMQPGPITDLRIRSFAGKSVQSDNPSGNGGKGERDWIVAFPQGNGAALRYFVFVAPTTDFAKFQPVFNRMLQSLVF